MKNMRNYLIKLLNIHAPSSEEAPVREYLIPVLEKLVDTVHVDTYGNLLAEKKVGNGNGATVLLSAHMDSVRNVVEGRELIEKNGVITASEGALGGDDRAGIAIILTVLENLNKLAFSGTIKIAFTREEEIGCKGSDKINPDWYRDVDLAMVCDRRGNRDIVVGCGKAFCSDSVGFFMEDVSKLADMDWECVEGGLSDAMTFSENGINSVNLSVGFNNEHTSNEYVVLNDMKDTIRLILQALAVINQFYDTFDAVPYENRWVKFWYYDKNSRYNKNKGHNFGVYGYYEDSYSDDIWAEEYDQNGDIYVYELGKMVIIQQGKEEIRMSRESLKGLINQLKNV